MEKLWSPKKWFPVMPGLFSGPLRKATGRSSFVLTPVVTGAQNLKSELFKGRRV